MSNEHPRAWRVTESTYVIDTPHLRLRKDTIILPSGERVEDYYVRETRGFAIIFALTRDERVILTREYRHGYGAYLLGLPGGQIDEDEAPPDCARRELAEETGYTGDPPELIGSYITAPVNSDGEFYVYLIRNARRTLEQSFDSTEDIAVELVPRERLRAMIRDGSIRISTHVLAIYAALDRLGLLSS
jgi:ADP-ribose pyrophosphatase